MSIALMVRIEALERRLAAMEAEMVRLRSAPNDDKTGEKSAAAKKKVR